MQREQTDVLMDVSEYLRPRGSAFYTVRRDLRRTGFRQHYKHGVPTYQTNLRLPFETEVRTEFCEIYRYRPYPQIEHESECCLCDPAPDSTLLSESAQSYSILAENDSAENRALVVPKRHVGSYFDLAEREQRACWLLVNRVQSALRKHSETNDFSVGVNLDCANIQTEEHTHINIIPK
jgi:diadenosine tetraphosphate (Ap4A) HIT family hydrolase